MNRRAANIMVWALCVMGLAELVLAVVIVFQIVRKTAPWAVYPLLVTLAASRFICAYNSRVAEGRRDWGNLAAGTMCLVAVAVIAMIF